MKTKFKLSILMLTLILFSSILIGASNASVEKSAPETQINENIETETFLLDLDEVVGVNKDPNLVDPTLTKKTKNEDEGAPSPSSTSQKEEKMIPLTLYNKGEKEIEGKIPASFKGEIKKIESSLEKNSKEVIVKSEEHLDSPLIVYTNIEETENKNKIEVYWKNEKTTVEVKEYLDTNNNGLIDRIGWIVPHLSEQVFVVNVEIQSSTSSNNIEISNIQIGTSSNPLPISFDISYDQIENVECEISTENDQGDQINSTIEISGQTTQESNLFEKIDLGLDQKILEIYCYNENNRSETQVMESKNFQIQELDFEINGIVEGGNYLNNNPLTFEVESPENSGYLATLYTPATPIGLASSGEIPTSNMIISGEYTLQIRNDYYEEPIFRNVTFYVFEAKINPSLDQTSSQGQVTFAVNLDSPDKTINLLQINFGDGSQPDNSHTSPSSVGQFEVEHDYTGIGTYYPQMTFVLGSEPFKVNSSPIIVEDPSASNQAPQIDLISPKNDQLITTDKVTFRYSATDDQKINSCTYELFIVGDELKELDYTTTDNAIIKGEENEVKLTAFEEGDYSWYVTCVDNGSKETTEKRDFTIQTSKHEYEEEIDEAMTSLEDFIEQEDSLSLDEKNALEELGITEDLSYYSKRLVQIDQDLGNNLKYISDENLRESRTKETIDELMEIIEKIPKSIEIVDSTEYLKNTLTADLEEITKQYAEGKNIQINPKEIRKLAEENELIQRHISTSTKIKRIKIGYKSETKTIISVKKELTLKGEDYNIILEQLPSEFENLQFKTKSTQLTPTLFEIKIEDLDEEEIIYYIEENLDLEELKETETVLFEEMPLDSAKITGYFSAPLSDRSNLIYLLIFLGLVIFAFFFGKDIIKKMQLNIWKREKNVRRILEYSEKAKKSLQSDDKEIAKEYYHKIKEIFPLVPAGFRNHAFSEIKKIRIGIDKRDMMDFVREYEQAKREKREQDAKRIYENIREQYKKLPEKHQQKVYERVIKDQVKSNFSL